MILALPYYSEIWRDIKGYEGKYQVSNFGRVKSLDYYVNTKARNGKWCKRLVKGRLRQLQYTSQGYYSVSFKQKGTKLVHRLVAEAFIPNPDNKPDIDHINTVRTDNRVENLRWATRSENMCNPLTITKIKSSFDRKNRRTNLSRRMKEKNPMSNPDTVAKVQLVRHNGRKNKPVIQLDVYGNIIKIWDSVRQITDTLGYHNISQCCQGKRTISKGYIWRYATPKDLQNLENHV